MKNINKNRMGRNIVLIGMPASGKSTIGKLLAKKMNYEYYDADRYLERKEDVKISTLFSEKGEEYFRNLETKYLKELSQKNGIIISTGGGAVKREKNMQILGEKGIIVFLNRKIEDIAKENHEARPLLQNIDNIYKLYDERIELYNRYSDIIVENNGTLKEVTDRIAEKIEKFLAE
jgi:shikimate kinase